MLLTHFKPIITAAFLCLSALLPLTAIQAQQNGNLIIREDSPENYFVVESDTLWDIAGVFLEEPWLWP